MNRDLVKLHHIFDCATEIFEFTKKITFEEFEENR